MSELKDEILQVLAPGGSELSTEQIRQKIAESRALQRWFFKHTLVGLSAPLFRELEEALGELVSEQKISKETRRAIMIAMGITGDDGMVDYYQLKE